MRELLIMRHGKSDWHAPSGADRDRPLIPRGVRAARAIGRFLERAGRAPDRILASSAVRAHTTATLVNEAGGFGLPVVVEPRLYEASVATVLDVVRLHGDRPRPAQRLLIAGHQPTSSALVAHLTGARTAFPTAALACVALELDNWREVERATGVLVFLIVPRLLDPQGDDD